MTRRGVMLAAMAVLASAPSAAAAPAVFGSWLTDDGSAVIRVEPCGAMACGRIERVLDPRAPHRDVNNPDPLLRKEPLVGTQVLSKLAGAGARWRDGRAYDPKAGKVYRAQIVLLADGRLKVTGCVLFVCRSRFWTRAR